MLSQSDFSGRVVNNDHFLYWGDIVKTNEEGVDFHIQVLNQHCWWWFGQKDFDETIKTIGLHFNLKSRLAFRASSIQPISWLRTILKKKHFFYLKKYMKIDSQWPFWSPWTTFTFIPGFNGILWTAFSFCFHVIEIRIYIMLQNQLER